MAFHQPTALASPLRQTFTRDEQEAATPFTHQKINNSHDLASRLSDFGSLNTIAQSEPYEDDFYDEDEELDSLDDGLHAFREPSMYNTPRRFDHSGGSILPAHDGLGTFAASSAVVQDQLWSFEQYNPHRRSLYHRRRRSSVQRTLDTIEDEEGLRLDNTRIQRIEKWRLEQSKILLEEVEKESRRRRSSRASEQSLKLTHNPVSSTTKVVEENEQTTSQSPIATADNPTVAETESFWQRITRRVIRDLMGIDDSVLAIIFGESLPTDEVLSTTPTPKDSFLQPLAESAPPKTVSSEHSWEDRLLSRLARELGILVHQLSAHQTPPQKHADLTDMDYAGIPVTHKADLPFAEPPTLSETLDASSSPQFKPTLNDRQTTASSASEHAARWGIEEEDQPPSSPTADTEYWERTPDLKTVFGYLQQRFTSQQRSVSSHTKSNIATANTPDSLRRAAIIRQHHPLVSRATKSFERHSRRGGLLSHFNLPQLSPSLKRPGTSCASLSTKKSRRDASEGSRNYWDIGESVGSGSAIAAYGGVGGWGEV